MAFPRQSEVEIPLLAVLAESGGSGRPRDVYAKVAARFPDLSVAEQEQRLESSPATRKWWNLVQWVRQHLVEAGEVDGSTHGVWTLTTKGRERLRGDTGSKSGTVSKLDGNHPVTLRDLANRTREEAKSRLLAELKALSPSGFEHFCMELLQQLGYRNVAVTRRSGDGGIDGYGDFRQGAVSIKSAFQAKRWAGAPVGRPDIDKLRGAIQGEYDHGVFITTSRFTKDAAEASYRKGAITILLLDGDSVVELMLERGIGVIKQPLYLYEISAEFLTLRRTSNSCDAARQVAGRLTMPRGQSSGTRTSDRLNPTQTPSAAACRRAVVAVRPEGERRGWLDMPRGRDGSRHRSAPPGRVWAAP